MQITANRMERLFPARPYLCACACVSEFSYVQFGDVHQAYRIPPYPPPPPHTHTQTHLKKKKIKLPDFRIGTTLLAQGHPYRQAYKTSMEVIVKV